MFDFGAAHRQEGEMAGKNDKGLVTFDRKIKKDAFYFYKANWNLEEHFVYITGKRFEKRSEMPQQIKIYSNQPEVELILNGKSLGGKKGVYGIFTWTEIQWKKGENILTARSKNGITDEVKILF